MAMSNEKMLESMRSMHERMKQMGYQPSYRKPEEKNPKQILLDWVASVKDAAEEAECYIDDPDAYSKGVIVSELRAAISNILGQCAAMEIVLRNSD